MEPITNTTAGVQPGNVNHLVNRGAASAAPPQLIYHRGVDYPVPEWARVPEIVKTFSIGRSSIYELIRSGRIASRVVKTSKHNVSGIRIVNTESVRAFIESQPSFTEETKEVAK